MEDFGLERYELVTERIGQIKAEQLLPQEWQAYFVSEARNIEAACEYLAFVCSGGLEAANLQELQIWNQRLYEEVEKVQGECVPLMKFLSAELRNLSFFAAQKREEEFLVRLELFAEIYGICVYEWQEEKELPTYKTLQECLYWWANDYVDMAPLQELQYLQKPEESPIYQGLQTWDMGEESYLYRYGRIITARECNLLEWMKGLPAEMVDFWAEGLTEEIQMLLGNKDGKKERRMVLQYPVGYEKLICVLRQKLREQGVDSVPEIIGSNTLLELYEKDFAGCNLLWDKAIAKRCREIRQTLAEKAEKENLFSIIKVVLKEEKNEILKPHVV